LKILCITSCTGWIICAVYSGLLMLHITPRLSLI
jgi:hypothetical protein